MTALKQICIAMAVGLLFVGMVRAQQPAASPTLRAVYVTGQDGNPKIYYVTGTVPPEKVPSAIPTAPTSYAPTFPSRTMQVRKDTPVHLPPVAETVEAASMTDASCSTGHCGRHCKHGPTSHWVCLRTPATIVPPLGSSVRSVFDMQHHNAMAEYFVVYREDWLDGKPMLNDTGVRHVDGIIRRYGSIAAPVKVEPTGIAELDQKRVTAILEKLIQSGIPAQETAGRVVLGTTRAEGLRGGDIEAINGRAGTVNGSAALNNFGGLGVGGFGGYGFGGIGGFGSR